MLRAASDYFSHSDTGRARRANEDAYYARAPVFVVADGMGGAQAGEVASRVAVETFEQGLGEAEGASPEELLTARVQEANGRIHDMAQEDEQRAGMGTTITAAHVGELEVAVAHVGDSRAYRLRGDEFERLTEDHSLVEEMRRRGQLTAEEADEHPQRSIITRALGPEADVEVDTHSFRGQAGDIYLLCSDGLTSMVPEAKVGEIILTSKGLEAAGHALVDAANAAGGRDNITVVLFRLEEVGGAAPPVDDQATGVGAISADEVQAALDAERAAEADHDPPTMTSASAAGAATQTATRPETKTEQPVRRLQPRAPMEQEQEGRGRRIKRAWTVFVVLAIFIVPIGAGGYLASQAVYFVGTNDDGFVTMYKGLPYELPLGVKLYSRHYTSGVPVDTLTPKVKKSALDHKLRSRDDADDYIKQLELGEISL